MPPDDELLSYLCDQRFLSVTELATCVKVSPELIPAWIDTLRRSGVPVAGDAETGFRLQSGIVPLDQNEIESRLNAVARDHGLTVQVKQSVDSTSRALARKARTAPLHGVVVIAESQPQGRGRRDNMWIASPYRNLMLSMGWSFSIRPPDFGALGLAVGIMVVDAVSSLGIDNLEMKWPNDIQYQGEKLGGILIEVVPGNVGQGMVIIGIGINVDIAPEDGRLIGQPFTDLHRISGRSINRNELAAKILSRVVEGMIKFTQFGFAPYRQRWTSLDVLAGRPVVIKLQEADTSVRGTAFGINADGALVVDVEGQGRKEFYSGDVSVRKR